MMASFWSYEYSRIMIWHGLNFEHFKSLEGLENLKNLVNWMLWTFWELTCSSRSILSSDLGLNSFESCFFEKHFQKIIVRPYLMSKRYTLMTFKGICMNFLLELNKFILNYPVTSKQSHKIVQIHMGPPVHMQASQKTKNSL